MYQFTKEQASEKLTAYFGRQVRVVVRSEELPAVFEARLYIADFEDHVVTSHNCRGEEEVAVAGYAHMALNAGPEHGERFAIGDLMMKLSATAGNDLFDVRTGVETSHDAYVPEWAQQNAQSSGVFLQPLTGTFEPPSGSFTPPAGWNPDQDKSDGPFLDI